MALRVMTMPELRREVLLEAQRTGEPVSSVCQRFGISRQTYYRYRRRLLLEGLKGLEDKSRKPRRSPGRMDPEVEIEICRLRKTHPRGWTAPEAPRLRASPVAMSGRAALRIVASLGALVVGGLAAATPGRFAGQGIGLGIAIVAGVSGFTAIVVASILDLRSRPDVRRGLVRELVTESNS